MSNAEPRPTIYEVLRQEVARGARLKTVQPTSAEEVKWYRVGYQMAEDYRLNEPVSAGVPSSLRFFWALGLLDGRGSQPDRTVAKPEPPEAPASILPAIGGALATLTGMSLLLYAGVRRRVTP